MIISLADYKSIGPFLMRFTDQAAAAAGTPTFTQDFTDSNAGFASDVKAAIFIGSSATANHTDTADAYLSIGVVTGSGAEWCVCNMSSDAATPNETARCQQQSQLYSHINNAGTTNGDAAFNSFLSNGIRINWTDQSVSELITCVLLGGDIEAKVVNGIFVGGAPETLNVAHGMSGTPEVVIQLMINQNADPGSNSVGRLSTGFWAASQQSAMTMAFGTGTSQSSNMYLHSAASGGEQQTGAALNYITTISAVDATNVSIATNATAGTDRVILLCLRGTAGAIVAKTGIYSTPTATGNDTPISGMSAAPQVLLSIPTRMTAVDTGDTTDSAAAYGLIAVVNNGGSQYGGATSTCDDAKAAPMDNSHETTNSQALRILAVAGTADVEATVNSWDSGGVTFNYSNINASAWKIPYLAFGVAVAALDPIRLVWRM